MRKLAYKRRKLLIVVVFPLSRSSTGTNVISKLGDTSYMRCGYVVKVSLSLFLFLI
jgi:hypothetical protein